MDAYVAAIEYGIRSRNGQQLAVLFSLHTRSAQEAQAIACLNESFVSAACERLADPYRSLAVLHVRSLRERLMLNNVVTAFDAQELMLKDLRRYLLEDKENWHVILIRQVAFNLWELAKETAAIGQSKMDAAVQAYRDCFNKTFNDKNIDPENSRRRAAIYLANLSFKCYFKRNNTAPCLKLVDSVKPFLEGIPKSLLVTFRYYQARLAIFGGRYEDADDLLTEAWKTCHISQTSNKRKISTYLVFVKMLRGRLPKLATLQKYKLTGPIQQLVTSVRYGNLHLFETTINQYQSLFIRLGVYLAFEERLKTILYRNLLKRTFLLRDKKSLLSLADFQKALQLNRSVSEDPDQVEGIVVNLIFFNYVKAYISHERQMIIFSKKDPFPSLNRLDL